MFRLASSILAAGLLSTSCAHVAVERPTDEPQVVGRAAGIPWWDGAVFYEVFVRSFKDSNGDGIGDLPGLTEKLDYLAGLGVEALWLMPVFQSPSYHGYDTIDYDTIEQDYGTNADFEALLAKAHRLKIRVLVDLVLNHTSNQHPWFTDSSSGPTSPKRDWYIWSHTNPGWGQPWNASSPAWHARGGAWYYGLFWSGMPDLNLRNPQVRDEMTAIAVRWAKKGVDGFRLDAVRHLIETGPGKGQTGSDENHVYLRELRAALRAVNPDVALVGEVWSTLDEIVPYFGNGEDELQMLFNFPIAGELVKGVWAQDATALVALLSQGRGAFPAGAVDAPFLTNHDQPRVATALGKDRKRLGLAAAILLTLPGAPFIYYGEELGMPNGPGSEDEWKRTVMFWDSGPGAGFSTHAPWHPVAPAQMVPSVAEQSADPASLLSRYRKLIKARRASPALGRGSLEVVPTGSEKVLAYFRREGTETVLVAHNLSAVAQTIFVAAVDAQPALLFADSAAAVDQQPGGWKVTLPAQSSAVARLAAR